MGDDTGQEAALFKLLFDPRNRVLLTRLSGPYAQDDLVVRDRAVALSTETDIDCTGARLPRSSRTPA